MSAAVNPTSDRTHRVTSATRRDLERTLAIVMLTFISTVGAWDVGSRIGLRINVDESMPFGAYRLVPGEIKVGEPVLDCLPPMLADYAVAKGILVRGMSCPGTTVLPILKVLAARSGDGVVISDRGVTINGALWPDSQIRRFDSHGRKVDLRLAAGRYVIPANSVFLMGRNPISWDARYWGSVPQSSVAGRMDPLVTWTSTTISISNSIHIANPFHLTI